MATAPRFTFDQRVSILEAQVRDINTRQPDEGRSWKDRLKLGGLCLAMFVAGWWAAGVVTHLSLPARDARAWRPYDNRGDTVTQPVPGGWLYSNRDMTWVTFVPEHCSIF